MKPYAKGKLRAPVEPPRRPLGVTILALFYIVLGSHALMFGAYLAALQPGAAPTVPLESLLAADAGLVRTYGLALLGISVPFFAVGVALLRRRAWARWAALAVTPLHIAGPPFLLGGVLFAALANAYLFGSERAHGWLLAPRPATLPEA